MKLSKYIMITILFTIMYPNKSTSITGDISYYYMHRLSNQEVINIPFRLLNLNVIHQNEKFDVNGVYSLEYRNRRDVDFLEDSNPSDINNVLRELYLTYYFQNAEISVGKKIYNWGSVDENSPIDVLNSFDNYYLLIGNYERKLGTYSLSYDYYVNNGTMKISGIFSPLHNTNRYPINDDQYVFSLPVSINPSQVLNVKSPAEIGLSIQQSFNRGDINVSYFRGHNRAPSLSGFNQYTKVFIENGVWVDVAAVGGTSSTQYFDLLFSYHTTEVANIGGVFLFDDFTIRYDYALFNTYDDHDGDDYLNHECYSGVGFEYSCKDVIADNPSEYTFIVSSNETNSPIDQEGVFYISDNYASYPLKQKVDYSQQTFQLELPLTDNYQLNLQYFRYEYNGEIDFVDPLDDGVTIALPNINLPDGCELDDLETCLFFTPSIGAPFAILSDETCLVSIESNLLDDNLKLTFSTLMDLDRGFGELASFEADYDMGNGLNAIIGITKVIGDDSVENYIFNDLEDFSNIRCEIKYHF